MNKAMIILNPSSGKEKALDYIKQIEEVLSHKGYEVTRMETAQALDATRFCQTACRDGCDLVVSVGGDGTLNETINGIMDQDHRPKLGIVPLGTVNDFARALRIPLDPEEAIRALSSSNVRTVDLGQLNGRLFSNVVAAGSLAESVASVTSEEKSRLGALAYLKEGIKELLGGPAHPIVVEHDGERWEGDSPLFLAALTNSVGGFEKLSPDASVDDGLIHGFIIRDMNVFNTIAAGLSLWFGSLKDKKDVIYFTAKKIRITSSQPLRTNVDGDEGPALPIEMSILPGYLQVIVPEEEG